jgi:hypothetical protein
MAVIPLSGTNIRFLSGVPFSNDYKNTRWFTTFTEQYNYFNSKHKVHTESQANFQRMTDGSGRTFIRTNYGIDDIRTANYVMFQNSSNSTKWWYGFITKLEYVQKNHTDVYFELDVLQTWMFDIDFKPSMVIREHCRQYDSNGFPIVNTVDEGLDYGSEYDIVDVNEYRPSNGIYYLVIVSKSMLHNDLTPTEGETTTENKIKASLNGMPQPLCYYIQPFKLDGSVVPTFVGGDDVNTSSIEKVLSDIYSQKTAVNNIVSMYVTEHLGYNPAFANGGVNFGSSEFEIARISSNGEGDVNNINLVYLKNVARYTGVTRNCGNKYNGFKPVKESKLKMYPYQVTLLTDFKGNQFEIKNEYISGTDLEVHVRGSMGVSNKVVYSLPDYLTHNLGTSETAKIPVSIQNSIVNNNPNDVSIINDMLSAYLQGNRNSIQNSQNSILWNGFFGAVNSGAQGLATGGGINPVGITNAATMAAQGAGNTVLQLQAIQAKQKDISNVPPSLSKMGSNTAFDVGHSYTGFAIVKKQIKTEYIRKLEDFFHMFGYKLNEIKIPNFKTRKNWNYIQTSNCHINGNFNNEDLVEMRQIFDNGITLWHTDDVGNYSLENGEI